MQACRAALRSLPFTRASLAVRRIHQRQFCVTPPPTLHCAIRAQSGWHVRLQPKRLQTYRCLSSNGTGMAGHEVEVDIVVEGDPAAARCSRVWALDMSVYHVRGAIAESSTWHADLRCTNCSRACRLLASCWWSRCLSWRQIRAVRMLQASLSWKMSPSLTSGFSRICPFDTVPFLRICCAWQSDNGASPSKLCPSQDHNPCLQHDASLAAFLLLAPTQLSPAQKVTACLQRRAC